MSVFPSGKTAVLRRRSVFLRKGACKDLRARARVSNLADGARAPVTCTASTRAVCTCPLTCAVANHCVPPAEPPMGKGRGKKDDDAGEDSPFAVNGTMAAVGMVLLLMAIVGWGLHERSVLLSHTAKLHAQLETYSQSQVRRRR